MQITDWSSDRWYIAVVIAGGVLAAAGAASPVGEDLKRALVLVGVGGFLFGVGEWIQHPRRERIGPSFKLTGFPRQMHPGGLLLDIAGIALLCRGLWLLW